MSHRFESLLDVRDATATGREVDSKLLIRPGNRRECNMRRDTVLGQDNGMRSERGTVSSILGLTLLSGGFSDGLVDCFGRDIECSRQSIDQPPSSMYVAGQ